MEQFTPDFIKELVQLIEVDNKERVQQLLEELHPADIAALYSELDDDQAEYIYRLLDAEVAADVLLELDDDERREILEQMPVDVIAKQVIDHMESDDAVDVIRELDEEVQEEILSHIDDVEQAGDIVDLLKYDEDTAGGIMATEMVVVNENWSMAECVKEMRLQAETMAEIYYVYVVDDDERLKGIFPLKKMITNPSVPKIKQVMERDPVSVKTDTSIEEVAQIIEKYDIVAVPVVDSIGRLVGRITVDDVMDEVREQSERDYQLASGISQDIETTDTVFTQTRARLPWLLIGIAGGIASATILGGFEGSLGRHPELALFIPLIGGTGGNVGIQSSAIVVQGLANGTLDIKNAGQQVFKETGVAAINATIISILVFAYNFFFLNNNPITAAVSLSLLAVVLFASIFGTIVPLTLEKCKIDPALATGPFITITSDIIGVLIYMGVCEIMLA